MKKGVKTLIKVTCILFAGMILLDILFIFMFLGHTDTAKRIQSPDKTKVALLIRREAFIDLNFVVKI